MKNFIEEAYDSSLRESKTVPSFTAFKDAVGYLPSGTVHVRTIIEKHLFHRLTVENRMALFRDNSEVDEVAFYSERFKANATRVDPELFVDSCVLTASHRIKAVQYQNPDQPISYTHPDNFTLDLRRLKHVNEFNVALQVLRDRGAIVFPVLPLKAGG